MGEFSPEEALNQLLKGTGMTFRYVDDKTVTIVPIAGTISPTALPLTSALGAGGSASGEFRKEGKGGSSDEFRVAQADSGAAGSAPAVDKKSERAAEGPTLQEIVVTAQKREERLQDVPVPVSVISGASLVESDQMRIQDYALTVPGFSVSGQNGFYQNLSIRGITTGTANPTVGIMIDDVPFGSSSIDGGGLFVPDIDPGDLSRVEVLRGPQGTLYGASSMGGLLKFVTIDPSTAEVSGRLSAGTSSISNGSELGYNARGSVNVPLSDSRAIRLSGFTREEPGYIDNPVTLRDDINKTTAYGGRMAALWRPSDSFSLRVSALYQDVKIGGDNYAEVTPGLGNFEQTEVLGAGRSDMKVQVYSATVTANLGAMNLTAISGYNVNSSLASQDYSAVVGGQEPFPTVSGARLDLDMNNAKFTQEIRLAMALGTGAEWLLGGFYSHEHTSYLQNLYPEDPITGAIPGKWVLFSVPQTYTEYSGFTDLTFHVTERLDIQLGARDSQIKQTSSETQSGAAYAALIGSPDPVIYPAVDSSVNAFTYLVTPRLKALARLDAVRKIRLRLSARWTERRPRRSPSVSARQDTELRTRAKGRGVGP